MDTEIISPMQRLQKWLLLGAIAAVIIIIDQISKNWVIANLELYESIQPVPALVPLFQITRSFNTGAAFGMLPDASEVFLVVALLIVIGLLVYYWRVQQTDSLLLRIALGMVVGGALGNVLDRMQHGHVVDFIHYQIPGLISNVSNLADHAIVLGVLLLLVDNWRQSRQQDAQNVPESLPLDQPPSES